MRNGNYGNLPAFNLVLRVSTRKKSNRVRLNIIALSALLIGLAGPAVAQSDVSWVIVVPWHGGGEARNCYSLASSLPLAESSRGYEVTQGYLRPLKRGPTNFLDKEGDSCIERFYSATTTDEKVGAVQKQLEDEIQVLKRNIEVLSNANDALTKRLTDAEAKLSAIIQTK